jgi:uncharacterized membrane protein YdjX (TVP38/TMEM64 family)
MRALGALALVGLLYLLWSAWDHRETLDSLRERGPLPFIAAMVLLPAVGVPMTPLFLLAGATFGRRIGLLAALLALALNLTLCYFIARSGLRRALAAILRRFNYELPDFSGENKRALRFVLAVKLTPGVPAFVKNYGLGATGVPFGLFMVCSMLVSGIYATLLVLVGESLLEHQLDRGAVAVIVLIALAAAVWWWRKRQQDRR